jgi:hypothetical protein
MTPAKSAQLRAPIRVLALPELKSLRELRKALAWGGLPPAHLRTPEDCARIGAFRVVGELLRVFDEYRRRVEGGEKCQLVEREHRHEPGRFLVELAIEVEGAKS